MMVERADATDPDLVYANYLRTCAMLGIEPTPREQALGLTAEWSAAIAAAGRLST